MSAYFFWMNTEGRAMVKKNNPDAPITEISKKCGEEWRAPDESAKKKFEKLQEEAKKNGGEEALKQGKKEKKEKKDKNWPSWKTCKVEQEEGRV